MRKRPSAAEQQEALALLKAGQPGAFPGAAPSARLHGRYAEVAWGVNTGANSATLICFEWEVEFQQEFADATAHADFWRQRVPLTQDWSARVRGYMTEAATASYILNGANLSGDPTVLQFTAYSGTAGGSGGGAIIFQGNCYVQRGRVLAPMAMVTQEVDLVGVTAAANIGA